MALYTFKCDEGHVFRKIADVMPMYPHCKCGMLGSRVLSGPSASVYETLDNGIQSKATVRPADAERIFKEIEIQADRDNPQAPDEDDLESIDTDGEFL